MTNRETIEALENAVKIIEVQEFEIPKKILELSRRKKVLQEAIIELVNKELEKEFGI